MTDAIREIAGFPSAPPLPLHRVMASMSSSGSGMGEEAPSSSRGDYKTPPPRKESLSSPPPVVVVPPASAPPRMTMLTINQLEQRVQELENENFQLKLR